MTRRLPARLTLGGSVMAMIAWICLAVPALAASPTATAGSGGDPRSSGQGPGLVGDPLLAVLIVIMIGCTAVGLTLLYVRMTGRRGA